MLNWLKAKFVQTDSVWGWQQDFIDAKARLKNPKDNQATCIRDKALRRCGEQIQYYSNESSKFRRWHNLYFYMTIIFSGILPFLVWLQTRQQDGDPLKEVVAVLIPLLPAIVAIFTSLESKYRWRDHHSRYAYTCEQLKAEMIKFQVHAGSEYADEATATANFVALIEQIALDEAREWRDTLRKNKTVKATAK